MREGNSEWKSGASACTHPKKTEAHSDKINVERQRDRHTHTHTQLDIYNISSGKRSHLVRQHFRMTKIVFIMDFFDASENDWEWELHWGPKQTHFGCRKLSTLSKCNGRCSLLRHAKDACTLQAQEFFAFYFISIHIRCNCRKIFETFAIIFMSCCVCLHRPPRECNKKAQTHHRFEQFLE